LLTFEPDGEILISPVSLMEVPMVLMEERECF